MELESREAFAPEFVGAAEVFGAVAEVKAGGGVGGGEDGGAEAEANMEEFTFEVAHPL